VKKRRESIDKNAEDDESAKKGENHPGRVPRLWEKNKLRDDREQKKVKIGKHIPAK